MGSNSNSCNNLTMLCLNISNIAVITARDVDHHCIIHAICKSKTVYLLESSVLVDCGYIYNAYQQNQY